MLSFVVEYTYILLYSPAISGAASEGSMAKGCREVGDERWRVASIFISSGIINASLDKEHDPIISVKRTLKNVY